MPPTPDFLRSGLELMILRILAQGDSYGYLIQKQLKEASPHWANLDISTLYRSLHRLERARWVKCRWERSAVPARKWYLLTPAGRRQVMEQSSQWRHLAEVILGPLQTPAPEPAK